MNNIFDQFDDPLDDLLNEAAKTPPATGGGVVEQCPKCGGTGEFRGYTGRVFGACFKCSGTGRLTFTRTAAVREKARTQRAERKERAAGSNLADFGARHPDVHKWLLLKCSTFEFAQSLLDAVKRYGDLTEKQMAAARRCVARDVEYENKKMQQTRDGGKLIPMDSTLLKAAFDAAVTGRTKAGTVAKAWKPKLIVDGLKYKPAPDYGKNPGTIYVAEHRGEKRWLGTLTQDGFRPRIECTPAQLDSMRETLADPKGRAEMQAQLYSFCGICGLMLTNHKSINRGIGPICYGRMGW